MLHAFDDLDYEFQRFPGSISTSSSAATTYRERIDLLNGQLDDLSLVNAVAQERGPDAAVTLLERRLAADPASVDDVYMLSAMSPPDRFLAVAEPYLRSRPVLVEWHRAYQALRLRESAPAGERRGRAK